MSLVDLLQACAAKLKELWPDREVYVGEIPQNANGAFSVGLTAVEQEQRLRRRHIRTVGMQVLYFREDRDTLAYLEWVEAMLDDFRVLAWGDQLVQLTNRTARNSESGDCYQFLFNVVLNLVEAVPAGESMEWLETTETMKGD